MSRMNWRGSYAGQATSGARMPIGRPRLAGLLLGLVLLATAHAAHSDELGQGFAGTVNDTFLTYIEALEYDLDICRADGIALNDSLRIDIKVMGWELDYLRDHQARWYNDPRLWFLVGAVSAAVALGLALNISF